MGNHHHHHLLVAVAAVVVLLPSSGGVVEAQSLCFPQFALANQACRFIHPKTKRTPGAACNYTEPRQGGEPRESACCRRLSSVDDACVCRALSRLPKFISRHRHVITLTPIPGCDVTFECDGTNI